MAIVYTPPSITVNQQGAQTLLMGGPTGKVICFVGTAPMGPDYPVLIDPAQAIGLFGDPASIATVGYTLPLAMRLAASQRSPSRPAAVQFLVCRVGVTRGTYLVKDSAAATVVSLSAIGKYAGSRSVNLQVEVVGTPGPTYAINFYDTVSGQQIDSFPATKYDLSTAAKIAAAINGHNPLNQPSSYVQATAGASNLAMTAISPTAFSAGTDGLGTAAGDASIATALQNSLWTTADYVWMGWDASSVAGASGVLTAHLSTAVSQNNFRKGVVGPAMGTTYTTLSGGSYGVAQSQRLVCMGHDNFYMISPRDQRSSSFDGYFLAAAWVGLKASAPTEETTTGWSLAGVQSIGVASGNTAALTPAQLNTLAGQGFLVFETPLGESGAFVRDAITTAPLSINGAINPFSQINVQDIDDAVASTLVAAVYPFKGRPGAQADLQITQIQQACQLALADLGQTTNGITSVVASYDPTTMIPTVNVVYVTRYPLLQIVINTSYTFS